MQDRLWFVFGQPLIIISVRKRNKQARRDNDGLHYFVVGFPPIRRRSLIGYITPGLVPRRVDFRANQRDYTTTSGSVLVASREYLA